MRRFLPTGVVLVALLAACSDDSSMDGPIDAPPIDARPEPGFPVDYAATYQEVRNCRKSADHDLDWIRVLADPVARLPYATRDTDVPDGGVLLKEEYEFDDDVCAGPVIGWTVMIKDSSKTDRLGWSWQKVDLDRNITELDADRCVNCHDGCVAPDGWDFTCAIP